VKNKVAPPFKQAEFDIIYGDGISWEGSVLEVGLERKVVRSPVRTSPMATKRLGQGRQNATAFLREHPDVVQAILREIQASVAEGQGGFGPVAAAGRGAYRGDSGARRGGSEGEGDRSGLEVQVAEHGRAGSDRDRGAARCNIATASRRDLEERLARAGIDEENGTTRSRPSSASGTSMTSGSRDPGRKHSPIEATATPGSATTWLATASRPRR